MAAGPTITESELFDPAFLEAVSRLRLVSKRVARGGRPAEQRSRDMGSGIEFRDFRPYSPGDDFRAIDWNIYRRLGRVFLRLFEELEDLPVYLLVDASESMYLEETPRAVAGLRCALALAAVALGQHDTVGYYPFGADMTIGMRQQSGKGRWMRFAEVMAKTEAQGSTDFVRSLKRFGALRQRQGLAVVISDFFDPQGAERVVEALKTLRHKVLLVQLVRESDRDPQLQGDLQLLDCETGQVEDVSVTPALLDQYRASYDRFQEKLTSFVRQRNAGLLRLDVDQPVVPQLATLFETGSLRV